MRGSKPSPEKYCDQCGNRLSRKRFGKRLEDNGVFRRRRFCDKACSGLAQRKSRVDVPEKYCGGCGTTKPADQFSKLAGGVDGLRWRCRPCEIGTARRWQLANTERHAANRRAHYEQHRDRLLANRRDRYFANHDQELARLAAWRARNPGRLLALATQWAQDHPERVRRNRLIRDRRARGAAGTATVEQIVARIAFYGWACWMCRAPWEHIDHVIPLARGGTNWPANLRPACKPCNLKKGARWSPLTSGPIDGQEVLPGG